MNESGIMREELNELSGEELKKMLLALREENALLKRKAGLSDAPEEDLSVADLENSRDYFSGCNRYRLFFESMSVGGYFSTPEGRFLQVNPEMVRMLGYGNEAELLSLNITEQLFLYPHERHFILMQASQHDQITSEYQAKKRDGNIIWIEDHIRFIRDKDGTIEFIEGNCYDITSRKKTEFALQHSEERFRLLAELLPQAVWEADYNGVFTYVNSSGYHHFGYTPEEVVNQEVSFFSVLAPEEHERAFKNLHLFLAGDDGQGREYIAVRKDGTRFPVLIYTALVQTHGKVTGYRGITVDISDIRAKEEVYLSTRAQLQGVLDAATETSIIASDPNGNILVFNKGAEKILGYSGMEVIGKMTPVAFHLPSEINNLREELHLETGQHLSDFETLIARARQYGSETREWTYIRKDGMRMLVNLVVSEVKDVTGKVIGYLGVGRDITEQKKAAQILRESELKYRTLFENLNDAVFIMNQKVFLDCNSRIRDIFRCDKSDIIGYSPLKFSPAVQPDGESSKEKAARYIKAVLEGNRQSFEWMHRSLDGHDFYAEVSLSPINIGSDRLIQAIVRDVNEKKMAEEAIRLSEERYRILLDNMSEVFMLVDNDDRVLYVNKRFTDILGYSREEIIGQIGYKVLIDPLDHAVIVNANNERREDRSGQYELYFRKRDGGKVLFLVNGAPYKDARGNVVGSIGTMTDITERKEAEYLLHKSQQLFQTLATISPVGIFRTDAKGRTTYVNPKWCELSGLSPEQALDDNWIEAVHPDDRQPLLDGWREHASKGENSIAEYRFLKADGQTVWVMGYAVPEVERGRIKGYVGTLTDISDRKMAEIELREKSQLIEAQNEQYLRVNEELIRLNEELNQARLKAEESDRLKSAFLANMSHEIRTPLNGIIGFAHVLSAFELSETERKEYTATLHVSCNRLLNTVNDILDISKIDAGQTTVKHAEYSPGKLLGELFRLQEPNYRKKGIELIMEPLEPLDQVTVYGDEQKVYQVINNLLDNALKFTPSGYVKFGASLKKGRISYFVQDTGIGIAREQQDFVFGRFNQENITLSREHEGSGLGLAITKGLVELMQGEITLDSEKGKGSLFRINLPMRYRPRMNDGFDPNLQVEQELYGFIKGAVLVAEDDEVNYQLIYSILRTATSDKIIRAANGTEVLDAMAKNPEIQLVLMDLKMPGMDGFEAIRRLRTLNTHVPVIVISAFANGTEESRAKEAGCNGFISKPYNPTTVLGKITEIVARQQALSD